MTGAESDGLPVFRVRTKRNRAKAGVPRGVSFELEDQARVVHSASRAAALRQHQSGNCGQAENRTPKLKQLLSSSIIHAFPLLLVFCSFHVIAVGEKSPWPKAPSWERCRQRGGTLHPRPVPSPCED